VTFRNTGSAITDQFYAKISSLTNAHSDDYLVSADNGRGQAGDIQSLGSSWSANGDLTFTFVIGLGHQETFGFFVDILKRP